MLRKVILVSLFLGFGSLSAQAMTSQECQVKFNEALGKISKMNKLSGAKKVGLTRAAVSMHDTCQAKGADAKVDVQEFFKTLSKYGN